ncbi:MAG: GTP-binding protein [Lachnospiraceae bacterium]|nr:GTP-binding protein [Lachnospiraceae bacterium]
MTKVDVFSGFLGAGKTTLIKKLIKEAFAGEQIVLIENEFGEIGIDGGFLKEAGIEIREMNSGCICCSLVGDFDTALKEVMETYRPQRIIIEPSGVGKLSDVIKTVSDAAQGTDMELGVAVTVVDAARAKLYVKNFDEFFTDQVANAGTIILSRTDICDEKKIAEAVELLRQYNQSATIVTTPISELSGSALLESMEGGQDLQAELLKQVLLAHEEDDDDDEDEHEHHHHHHDDDEDEHEHHHHHHDDDDDDEDEHEHHHHHHDDDDDDEDEHEHHHHHHDDDDDDEHEHHHDEHVEAIIDEAGNRIYRAHHHHHHHHGHAGHDADEIFESWGMETPGRYTAAEIEAILDALDDTDKYGMVLRAKGMVPSPDGTWVHYDYVPGEKQVRTGSADVTGKICVIGSALNEEAIEKLFKKA